MQALAEQSRIVRLPLNKVGLTNRISRTYSQLEQEFERAPTIEEIAEVLNIDVEEVSASMRMTSRHVSMDSPLSDGEESTLIDVLVNGNAESADQQIIFNDSLKQEIQRSLTLLTPRQKEVICYFYGIGVDEPVSLEDLGLRYGLTRERVRQIKDKALEKLKSFTGSNLLKEYMGV
jgi:RNA polymerase primary sigma factor